jgi:hypothetical protein
VLHPGSDEPLASSFVDLQRAEGRDAEGARAVELAGDVPAAVRAPGEAPPAETAALRAPPDLPPVLRAYVAAYLRRLGETR